MRRFAGFLLAVLLLVCCAFSVSAAPYATDMTTNSNVNRDSSCQVSISITLQIDEVRDDLEFPIPAEATAVRVRGDSVRTKKNGNVRVIDLDKLLGKVTGKIALTITYTLPDVIHVNDDGILEMQIPLLSGFAYPIREMEFSVTMPGTVEGTMPSFESGYHQASIEQDLRYSVEGATISGSLAEGKELKDHETLMMRFRVSQEMFPQTLADTRDYTFGIVAMYICGGLALLYWLLTLRVWPFKTKRNTHPLAGCTAGELGCVLNQQGVDLHLTVLSWAQLGYLMIRVDSRGRVILCKRMEMGNERKESEQKLFRKLFAKRDVVDTTSLHYASMIRYGERHPLGMHERMHKRTGNAQVFRILASGIGLFGGVCIAIAMSGGAFLQGLLILILGALGGLSGWYIQKWGQCLLTPHKNRLLLCLAVAGIWLLLGLLAGAFSVALGMVLGLMGMGLLYSWGGRRSDLGKEVMAQTLGLRQYLRKGEKVLLQRLQNEDPDYFFSLAPYAMALGVEKAFAKRFGNQRLEGCPYLITGKDKNLTAMEWMERLRFAVESMDERSQKLPLEKLLGLIQSMKR